MQNSTSPFIHNAKSGGWLSPIVVTSTEQKIQMFAVKECGKILVGSEMSKPREKAIVQDNHVLNRKGLNFRVAFDLSFPTSQPTALKVVDDKRHESR